MADLYSKNDIDPMKKEISQFNSEQTKKIKPYFSKDVKSSRKRV